MGPPGHASLVHTLEAVSAPAVSSVMGRIQTEIKIANKDTDTPQFRGGNPYFFSENPYQSVSFICINVSRKRSRDSYHDAVFAKKIATLCNKNRHPAAKNQNRSFSPTSRGATDGLGLRL